MVLTAVLAGGVALAGCSSSSTASGSSTSTSTSAAASVASSSAGSSSMASSSAAVSTSSSAAASSGPAAGGTASSAPASAGAGPINLKGVCPDTVSIQTDWNPESEHGGLYGTGNYGQAIPLHGGIVLDLSRASRILEVGDGFITAEAGATMNALERAARKADQ